MSFRGRLTLFFVLIVVVPMVVIAVLATRTADEAARGKADARLFAGLETATAIHEERQAEAREAAERVAADTQLAQAIRAGDPAVARAATRRLAVSTPIRALELRGPGGEELASVGGEPFAAAEITLTDGGGARAGTLTVSTTSRGDYLRAVEQLTGREAEIRSVDDAAVSLGGERVEVPAEGGRDVVVDGGEVRALAEGLAGEDGASLVLFDAPEDESFLSSSPTVVVIVAGILLLALLMVLLLRRALARQVAAMLAAARRIGQGDFSEKVPVVGGRRDEMAGLAIEFNKMSGLLAEQMDQLRSQQVEIDRSVRRIGEAFASGLDRDQLLGILVETTVSACRADYGVIALSGREGAEVSSGQVSEAAADAVLDAEAEASRSDQLVSREAAGTHIVAAPLRPIGDPGHSLGVMAIARARAFTDPERDVFLYLIGQASASIENVSLHELVSEQAVTDGLTGLANNRAFREVTEKEAARAERFGHALSLLMLDIDDFKKVNDTHGHLQGDEVLRRVGRILQAESRGIDEPARYGGEEFAVALPETDRRGAMELAERVRERIEAEDVPFLDRRGALKITASLGVATIPESAADVQGLIAAADAALYAAKRSGKNRVSLAPARSTEGHRRAAAAAAEHGG